MLVHSREGSGEHRPIDINALVEEALNLAYHGARAEKQSFTITLERSFDPVAGQVDVFPQEITRVLLNVIARRAHDRRSRTQRSLLRKRNGAALRYCGLRREVSCACASATNPIANSSALTCMLSCPRAGTDEI
jgi:nitrogen-specific signal transduction histidine kinase